MRGAVALLALAALLAPALPVGGQEAREAVIWFDGSQNAPLGVRVASPYQGVPPPTLVPLSIQLASQNGTTLRLEGSVVHRLPNGTEEELLRLDRTVAPYQRETLAVNVWINETGLHSISFVSRSPFPTDRTATQVRGLPPLDVRLESPPTGEALVVIPGTEATIRLNITSRATVPFRNLTFRIEGVHGATSAKLPLLPPSASRSVELALSSAPRGSGILEYLGKDEAEVFVTFNGTWGASVLPAQPLFTTDTFPPTPIVLPVYVATRPSVFLAADTGALGEPSEYRVILVNPGDRSLSRSVEVRFEKSGFPALTRTETLRVVAPAGGVGKASGLWVPDASGGWSLVATGRGLAEARAGADVEGPLAVSVGHRLQSFPQRGDALPVSFDVSSAAVPVRILGFGLALGRVPYTGPVAARDFFDLDAPSGTFFLKANGTRTFNVTITPRASGWWSVGLVVETERGLVVADELANLEVRGQSEARWLLFVPSSALLVGLAAHVVWRRWGAA